MALTHISVALFRFKKWGGDMGVNSPVLGGFRTTYFNLQVAKYHALLNKIHTENYNALI